MENKLTPPTQDGNAAILRDSLNPERPHKEGSNTQPDNAGGVWLCGTGPETKYETKGQNKSTSSTCDESRQGKDENHSILRERFLADLTSYPGICLTPWLERIRKGESTWEEVHEAISSLRKESQNSLKK